MNANRAFAAIAGALAARYAFALAVSRLPRAVSAPTPCAENVTVLIVAYNEAPTLSATIYSFADLDVDVLVLDDGSDDDTEAVLGELCDEAPWLRVATGPHLGKMPTLRAHLRDVRTPLVLTIDADTWIGPDALTALRRAMANGQLTACAGSMRPLSRRTYAERMQTAEFALLNADRAALARFAAVSILPGALTIWRTAALGDLVERAANDIDLTLFALREGHRTGYCAEAVGWTAVPATTWGAVTQRRRWARRKINRAPGIVATACRRDTPARARVAYAHLLGVHCVLSLTSWWIDARFLYVLMRAARGAWTWTTTATVAAYAGLAIAHLAVVGLAQAPAEREGPPWTAGAWERTVRGAAAWSTLLWPRRNAPGWRTVR